MASRPDANQPAYAGTSLTKIYGPVPTGYIGQIKEILLCNKDTSARQLGIYRRDAADVDWEVRNYAAGQVIAAGNTEVWHTDMMLAADEEIYVKSDAASKVACHISVIEHQLAV